MAKETNHAIVSANGSRITMSKSNGKKMRLKVGDRVIFQHVAMGLKPMTGTLIEESVAHGWIVRADNRNRIYPGIYIDNPKALGTIIKKIKK